GGPSSTTCLAACSATVRTSRSRPRPMTGVVPATGPGWCSSGCAEPAAAESGTAGSGTVMQDEAPDVLAVQHDLVTLVDLVEGVGLRDQLIQLQVTGAVELRHPRNVMERVARAKQAALHALFHQRQHGAVELDVVVHQVAQASDHDRPGLPDRVER